MKLTVAGYWGGYPEKGSATSCYVVESGSETFLLDCGSGALAALPYITELTNINSMVISHRHHDHVADIGSFVYSRLVALALKKTSSQLQLYAPAEEEEFFRSFEKKQTCNIYTYEQPDTVQIGDTEITFLPTGHPVPCYAMRLIENNTKIVYTADAVFDEGLIPFCKDADLLIAECSFYGDQDAKEYGHMNSREAAEIAERAGVKELWLTHLPHFGEHTDLLKEAAEIFSGTIQLAHRELSWENY
ncbi:MBL fold metallo-hydrolase [Alkalicoccus daliensis]|uniref:Ribonuclease BN, tRNA processing enzyme n=1 Tax=Alkalicoccus daliensis TaxID=745820 RepID=A0A1H0CP45_9BACI|nr:MBL fold metallo-hydrolase [Alkalicoccus daliensis]SDN59638.1 Ribonuclease BN, tRNA processing enzyme [Alkalicoccus daliensis]